MDDVLRLQVPGPGRDRLANGDRGKGDRLLLDLRAARTLDRTGHSGAHPELVVRRVRERVDVELGDVAFDDLQLHARNPSDRSRSAPVAARATA